MEQNRPQRPTNVHPAMRRPGAPTGQPTPHRAPAVAPPPPPMPPKKSKAPMIVGLIALVLIALTIVGAGIMMMISNINATTSVKSNEYQAVFLTNNLVYFGKIGDITEKYVKLTDIYYLQPLQAEEKAAAGQPQIKLVKLGSEVHGPEDTMYINSREILFWENLKNDSKIANMIKEIQAKNGK